MATQPQQTTEPQPQQPTALAPRPAREVRVVQDTGPLANLFDTARFEHLQRIAALMAQASLIPDHLKGKSAQETMANCFLIVNAAVRFGFDPFQFAPETYFIGGKLAYQGKLVLAIVNARAGLKGRLRFDYNNKPGDDLTITVSGTFEGETEARSLTVRLGDAKTQNKMWKEDPYQKLVYTGSIRWARRYCPDVILGVITDDEAELMRAEQKRTDLSGDGAFIDVTPAEQRDPEAAGEQGSSPAPQAQAGEQGSGQAAAGELQSDDLGAHMTVTYGKDKGKRPSELDDAALKVHLSGAKASLDKPKLIGHDLEQAEAWFQALAAEAAKRGLSA